MRVDPAAQALHADRLNSFIFINKIYFHQRWWALAHVLLAEDAVSTGVKNFKV